MRSVTQASTVFTEQTPNLLRTVNLHGGQITLPGMPLRFWPTSHHNRYSPALKASIITKRRNRINRLPYISGHMILRIETGQRVAMFSNRDNYSLTLIFIKGTGFKGRPSE